MLLRGARTRSRSRASETKLRTPETHRGRQGGSRARGHPAAVPAAGAPVPHIYSFNNNKSHLFIPFGEGPCPGRLSGGFRRSPFPSVRASPVLTGPCLVCAPTRARLSSFGSCDPPVFPGGCAPSSRAGPSGSASLTGRAWGGSRLRGCGSPRVSTSLLTLGLIHLCTRFYFFRLPWVFRCGFGLAFGFVTDISHVPLQKLRLSRGPHIKAER